MFAILLFLLLFKKKKSLEGKKLETTVTNVKTGKAPGPEGFSLGFCLIKNVLYSEIRTTYFRSGLGYALLFRGNLFQRVPGLTEPIPMPLSKQYENTIS